jgi:hypothetical protein
MVEAGTKVLAAGDKVMVITDRVRHDIDKNTIKALVGDDVYKNCFHEVKYQTFEVKNLK